MKRDELAQLIARNAFVSDQTARDILRAIESAGFAIVPMVASENIFDAIDRQWEYESSDTYNVIIPSAQD
jgi:hypothetical protein